MRYNNGSTEQREQPGNLLAKNPTAPVSLGNTQQQQDSAVPGEVILSRELAFLPIMSMEVAKQRRQSIVEFVQSILVEDEDFGKVGGSPKPTLLKPGAETSIRYVTGSRFSWMKEPLSLALRRRVSFVPELMITTLAPGTSAPDGSRMLPLIPPRLVCAGVMAEASVRIKSERMGSAEYDMVMEKPLVHYRANAPAAPCKVSQLPDVGVAFSTSTANT